MRPEAEIDFTPGTVNGAILFDTDAAGYESFSAQVFGTFVGTITFEQSVDRVTWQAVSGMNATATGTANPLITTATAPGIYVFPVLARFVRARVTAFTSGSINGRAYMRNAVFMPIQAQWIQGSVTQNIAAPAALPTELRASATATGATSTRVNAAAGVNATVLKATAGNVFDIILFNASATPKFMRFYNKATAPITTDVPLMTMVLAPGVITRIAPVVPIRFAAGISYNITGALPDNDATAVAAQDVTGLVNWA